MSKTKIIFKHLGIYVITCIVVTLVISCAFGLISFMHGSTAGHDLSGRVGVVIPVFLLGVPVALVLAFLPYLLCILSIKYLLKRFQLVVYVLTGGVCGASSLWIFLLSSHKSESYGMVIFFGLVGLFAGWVYYALEKRFFGVES